MKFTKPHVAWLASATDAIQSSQVKGPPIVLENAPFPENFASTAAYEADE